MLRSGPITVTEGTLADRATLRVPLNGFAIQLRPSELESVASGLGQSELSALVEALWRLPVNDRAPAWELAVRHFGRGTELAQAAGEIGMDRIHAVALVEDFLGPAAARTL